MGIILLATYVAKCRQNPKLNFSNRPSFSKNSTNLGRNVMEIFIDPSHVVTCREMSPKPKVEFLGPVWVFRKMQKLWQKCYGNIHWLFSFRNMSPKSKVELLGPVRVFRKMAKMWQKCYGNTHWPFSCRSLSPYVATRIIPMTFRTYF